MLTVALWDLRQGKRPPLSSIPKYLRRVGADVVTLLDPPEGNGDSFGRHSGYRSRVLLENEGEQVAVFARRGLIAEAGTDASGVSKVEVRTEHGQLTLLVVRLEGRTGAQEAAKLVSEHTGPLLITGDLGHDMSNPQGTWALLRKDLIDHIEHSGAPRLKARTHGFLSRGVQPRGGSTIEKAAGGGSDLVWVRIAV